MINSCKQCIHYVQHYGLFEGKLRPIFCGHCLFEHRKCKKPDAAICDQFIQNTSPYSKMVTKEYLTKKLLQHILDMELWQPLED